MVFVKGLGAPETPRLLEDNSWLCVEMAPHRGGVTHISADGQDIRLVAKTGTPNGCLQDMQGNIWVAETAPHPSLMRVTLDGIAEVYMDKSNDGKSFLLPNDLCFAKNALLYMTDSGILMRDWVVDGDIRPDYMTAAFDGRLYQIDLAAKSCVILDDGMRFANGIAMGPDGHLYANEMITGDIYRYAFNNGMPTGSCELFGNVMAPDWSGGFRGPDGMAFGQNGYLYCTVFGQGDVTVLDTNGDVVRRIPTEGKRPTNVAFGPNGEPKIYVTEHQLGQIEVLDVDTAGLPLYYGS